MTWRRRGTLGELYRVPECPVCVEPLVCLRAVASRRLLVLCTLCGCAFREPPPRSELNEPHGLDDLAPDGVELPTRAEIDATGWQGVERLPSEPWLRDLREHLERLAPACRLREPGERNGAS